MAISLMLGLLLMTVTGAAPESSGTNPRGEHMITDFTADSPDLGWYVQNDNVMGGRSEGGFKQTPGTLIFSGSTNTNGGGFIDHDGIRLHVKGDKRRYIWQLQTNARWRGRRISYNELIHVVGLDGDDQHIA